MKSLAMLADQRRWSGEDQRLAPIEPAGKPGQGHPSRLRGTTWLDLAFLVEGQLFAQKEVLCCPGRTGAQAQAWEAPRIHEEHPQRGCAGHEVAEQARASSHGGGIPMRDTLWFPAIIPVGRRDVQSERMEFLRRTRGSSPQGMPNASLPPTARSRHTSACDVTSAPPDRQEMGTRCATRQDITAFPTAA
jgi:hypothetical protein